MCHITKNIYTVCAHSRVGELVECQLQKARIAQWQNGGWCANFLFTLRSCRPVELPKLKYWFCDDCRDYYRGYDTNSVDSILKYWTFKNLRQYSFSVSPKLVPADLVFGSATPAREDLKMPRLELIALDKAWPRTPFETRLAWLQRLETARTITLELAEEWSRARDCQAIAIANDVVRMQPRISTPMSIYPFDHAHAYDALGLITELSNSQTTTTRPLPSLKKKARELPQVHPETLQKLCGEVSSKSLAQPEEAPRPRTADPAQGEAAINSRLTSPFDHEAPLITDPEAPLFTLSTEPTPSATRCLTAPRTQQQSGSQDAASASATPNRDSVRDRSGKGSSGSSNDSTLVATSADPNGQVSSNVGLNTFKDETGDEPPNMTSHFSVSSIDPEDAAELASVRTISPAPRDVVLADVNTETVSEDNNLSASATADSAPEIVSPTPVRRASPPRFI